METSSERGNGPRDPNEASILERGQAIREEASSLLRTITETKDEVELMLLEQLEQRPYLTLAAAAGAGYLLGKTIPLRLARMLFDTATKIALASILQGAVAQAGGARPQEEA